MPESKKELILAKIENLMLNIKKTNLIYDDVYYQNDVGYVDRHFINITQNDIEKNGVNWIIINQSGEKWKPLVGGAFENKIEVQIIGFTQVLKPEDNLSTLINSLQKDVMLAMIKDVELDRLCDYLIPVSTRIVDNMIYPYGGFVTYFDVVYTTQGLEI